MKPLETDIGDWDGRKYVTELYPLEAFDKPSPIRQVQAVCFDKNKDIVLYWHVKQNKWALPGGRCEREEELEETLKREIDEEISATLINWDFVAWEKYWWEDKPNETHYNARAWANVRLSEWTPDPDSKAVKRKTFTFKKAKENLGYGEAGRILLDLAWKANQ